MDLAMSRDEPLPSIPTYELVGSGETTGYVVSSSYTGPLRRIPPAKPAKCQICCQPECEIDIPAQDKAIVVQGLHDQYGRSLQHIAPLSEFARHVVHDVAEAGRLGDSEPRTEDWAPSAADIDAFNPQGVSGMMRLWRAEEIGHYALLALGRAGRLLPRDETRRTA